LGKFAENGSLADSGIFPLDEEHTNRLDRQVYSVWSFSKLTNKTAVFGSIPQQMVSRCIENFTENCQLADSGIFPPRGVQVRARQRPGSIPLTQGAFI
jgi:hypothetical protein